MTDVLAPTAPAPSAVHGGWTLAAAVASHPLAATVLAAFGVAPDRDRHRTLAELADADGVDLEALLYCIGSVVASGRVTPPAQP